jgi:hypothetical protein
LASDSAGVGAAPTPGPNPTQPWPARPGRPYPPPAGGHPGRPNSAWLMTPGPHHTTRPRPARAARRAGPTDSDLPRKIIFRKIIMRHSIRVDLATLPQAAKPIHLDENSYLESQFHSQTVLTCRSDMLRGRWAQAAQVPRLPPRRHDSHDSEQARFQVGVRVSLSRLVRKPCLMH